MFRFYAGKGGVGKTTCAAAAALALSRRRRRTLVVSTDPAHSLADALEARLSASPRRVRGSLFAAQLDADRALSRWLGARERSFRVIASRGTYLDDEDIDSLFRLSLPGVDELVGLVELRRLARGFEDVVVDTAPTGHTLRLLAMPATLAKLADVLDDLQGKHRAMARSLRGSVRRDAEDAVIDELREEAGSLRTLLGSDDAEVHWVTLAEALSLAESRDGIAALRAADMRLARVVVNRLTPRPERRCRLCAARRAEEARMLEAARALGAPLYGVPEKDREPRGVRDLDRLSRALEKPLRRDGIRSGVPEGDAGAASEGQDSSAPGLEELAPAGVRLVLFGGKGGVGKTTVASAAAISIARRAGPVLLLSTDPAHSLTDVLGLPLGDDEREIEPGLCARELDAARAFERRREKYRAAVEELFATLRGGSSFDAPYDRAVMEDLIDLSPPGLDEVFALLAVIEALHSYRVLVVDTAPTGHALRLLELAAKAREWVQVLLQIQLKYRRVTGLGDLARDLTETARELRELQELLQDPARCRFVPVTQAAALPRLETARLLASLKRLRVAAPVLLVNALTPKGCSRCNRAAAGEQREIGRLRRICRGCAMLAAPRIAPAPQGAAALARFARTWKSMQ
jgi:arsenite/tail-anchored protein-transporting ATPase